MPKSRSLQKRIQKNRAKSLQRRSLSHKKRTLRYSKGYRKPLFYHENQSESDINKQRLQFDRINLPENFSLKDNTEQVLKSIQTLDRYLIKRKPVYVNSRKINKITPGAVLLLISKLTQFDEQNVDFEGNYPRNPKMARIFRTSGFNKFLLGEKLEGDNSVIASYSRKTGKEVVPGIAAKITRKAVKDLLGTEGTNHGIYRVLIEAMNNTYEHASLEDKGNERWWLLTNHDKENGKIIFVFLDNGVGIVHSIKREMENDSRWDKFIKGLKSEGDILAAAFDGKEGSRTGERFKGKGLPTMYKSFNSNFFSEFNVISNRAHYSFKERKKVQLGTEFNGTFLYFEFNKENVINSSYGTD